MLDALLSPDADESFTQDDLHEFVGLPRKTVWMHVERLTSLRVLETSDSGYVTSETNPVLGHVRAIDAAVLGTALLP
jgi:DNA-binding IclR family transcriptional regulator